MTDISVNIIDQQNQVTVSEDGQTAVIQNDVIEVISVGIQGPRGPSGVNTIGGKQVQDDTPLNNEILIFNASSDEFEFTTEIDAGTY
jgi:hypothetical protein